MLTEIFEAASGDNSHWEGKQSVKLFIHKLFYQDLLKLAVYFGIVSRDIINLFFIFQNEMGLGRKIMSRRYLT